MKILLRPHNIFWGDLEFVCSKNTFGLEKHLEVKQKTWGSKVPRLCYDFNKRRGGEGAMFWAMFNI